MANEQLFQERLTRINKTINFEPVDRVPLIYMGTATTPRQMGMTIAEFIENPIKAIDAAVTYMDQLGVDGCNVIPYMKVDVSLSPAWLSRIKMPGKDLPEDSLWQVEEKETMKVEDYDIIINQGFQAFMGQMLPKVIDMEVFQAGIAQMKEAEPIMYGKLYEHGFVTLTGGVATIPFETLCGGRSMMPFFMDLYRMPEKVKEAMDIIMPALIGQAVEMVNATGIRRAWVGGWRSASTMLAPKLWDEFVFPYMLEVVNALAEQDIISILHLDQDWGRDMARFLEMPAKKCILNPDGMTDIRNAKKILGDHMAILGDVPSSLLASGTPDDVYNYVRDLIKDVGPEGLLLCPGCDAPINAKGENMTALYDAGREFGKGV